MNGILAERDVEFRDSETGGPFKMELVERWSEESSASDGRPRVVGLVWVMRVSFSSSTVRASFKVDLSVRLPLSTIRQCEHDMVPLGGLLPQRPARGPADQALTTSMRNRGQPDRQRTADFWGQLARLAGLGTRRCVAQGPTR